VIGCLATVEHAIKVKSLRNFASSQFTLDEKLLPHSRNFLGCICGTGGLILCVSSTGIEHVVNRVLYCATGTEFYISPG
jgi:hypothetical protein